MAKTIENRVTRGMIERYNLKQRALARAYRAWIMANAAWQEALTTHRRNEKEPS